MRASTINFYESSALDRATHHRKDKAWLKDALAGRATRFVPVWKSENLIFAAEGASPRAALLGHDALGEIAETVLLGLADGVAHFAAVIPDTADPATIRADGASFVDLRKVGSLMPRHESALLAYARGIAYWHQRHRFCSVCGKPSLPEEAGHVRRCTDPVCDAMHFPRTDPAVIMLIHDGGERCLLGRQKVWLPGTHSTLAGFVEPGESLEQAVIREVWEETGVSVTDPVYHSSQPWPFPASLMLGFHARATSEAISLADGELEHAAWYERGWILNHGDDDEFRLPRKDSVARQLVESWLRKA